MKCKKCDEEIDVKCNCIQYIKTGWKGAGNYQGGFEHAQEVTIDAGIFCSDDCLINYLEENKEK